jgi:hypothetical protein
MYVQCMGSTLTFGGLSYKPSDPALSERTITGLIAALAASTRRDFLEHGELIRGLFMIAGVPIYLIC